MSLQLQSGRHISLSRWRRAFALCALAAAPAARALQLQQGPHGTSTSSAPTAGGGGGASEGEGARTAALHSISTPSPLLRCLRAGGFGQSAGDVHGVQHYWLSRRFEERDRLPAFRAELLRKDLRLSLELADAAGAPPRGTRARDTRGRRRPR